MRFFPIILLATILLLSPALTLGALSAPEPIYPTEKDSPVWKGKIDFNWKSTGAPFYIYSVDNLSTGEQKTWTRTSTPHAVYGLALGDYRWRVRSCNDREGADCSGWSLTQAFSIIPTPLGVTGGLIPCGRQYDEALTANDESKPCGLAHIVLLLKNILDFILWRLGLLVIAGLAVFTGFFTYFSFGAPDIGMRIKALWRSLFTGYLVLLFAWVIINVFLNVLGFQVQLFGVWWNYHFDDV